MGDGTSPGIENLSGVPWPQDITADRGKLRQILINLLANAVKYTNAGKVVLKAESLGTASQQSGRLRFDVEDTGIGIRGASAVSGRRGNRSDRSRG